MSTNSEVIKHILSGKKIFDNGKDVAIWYYKTLRLIKNYELIGHITMVKSCCAKLNTVLKYQKQYRYDTWLCIRNTYKTNSSEVEQLSELDELRYVKEEIEKMTPDLIKTTIIVPMLIEMEKEQLKNVVNTADKPRARVNLL